MSSNEQQDQTAASRVGQILRETYRLERLIGQGGMGEVYEAKHVAIPRRYAIKFLSASIAGVEAAQRFHREATIAASLNTPHIVDVVDFNKVGDGTHFMAMEMLDGQDLRKRLEAVGRMDPATWLVILEQIADGLGAAHEANIVHRDMKPDNIFLAKDHSGKEVVKILDFGVSKVKECQTLQTQEMAYLGTPAYMSPEQAQGSAKTVDARSDIYSMGSITYEVLSGTVAFDAGTPMLVLFKICNSEPVLLQDVAPWLPASIVEVVNRAMRKNPAERFQSIREFVDAFRAALYYGTGAAENHHGQALQGHVPVQPGAQPAPASNYPSNPQYPSGQQYPPNPQYPSGQQYPSNPQHAPPPSLGSNPAQHMVSSTVSYGEHRQRQDINTGPPGASQLMDMASQQQGAALRTGMAPVAGTPHPAALPEDEDLAALKSKGKFIWIASGVGAAVVVIGLGAFLLFGRSDGKPEEGKKPSASSVDPAGSKDEAAEKPEDVKVKNLTETPEETGSDGKTDKVVDSDDTEKPEEKGEKVKEEVETEQKEVSSRKEDTRTGRRRRKPSDKGARDKSRDEAKEKTPPPVEKPQPKKPSPQKTEAQKRDLAF